MQVSPPYKILLFGSGFVGSAVAQFYKSDPEVQLTISSFDEAALQKLQNLSPSFKTVLLDISKASAQEVEALISGYQVVISLLPAFMHLKVAQPCLKLKKHLVTSSYVSPEMAELNNAVAQAGLTFLNECGLDPGIDHMATMKLKKEIQAIKELNEQEKQSQANKMAAGLASGTAGSSEKTGSQQQQPQQQQQAAISSGASMQQQPQQQQQPGGVNPNPAAPSATPTPNQVAK